MYIYVNKIYFNGGGGSFVSLKGRGQERVEPALMLVLNAYDIEIAYIFGNVSLSISESNNGLFQSTCHSYFTELHTLRLLKFWYFIVSYSQ